jgi:hypothetical protein
MNGASGREVDLDLLADYAAGALAPAEAAEVDGLVAADDAWADALAEVRAADTAVRAELRALAHREVLPMPADLIARLDAALASAGPSSGAASGAAVVPMRRSGRRRWSPGLSAAAAAVAVLAGLGVVVGTLDSASNEAAAPSMAEAPGAQGGNAEVLRDGGLPGAAPEPGAAPPQAVTDAAAGPLLVASGTDYSDAALTALAGTVATRRDDDTFTTSRAGPAVDPPGIRPYLADAEPVRVGDPAELAECLRAVAGTYPGRAEAVDYARYAGAPALVVVVRNGASVTVVAVGPGCGRAGLDLRRAARSP